MWSVFEADRYLHLAKTFYRWAREERQRAAAVREQDPMLSLIFFTKGETWRLSARLLKDELRASGVHSS